MTAAEVVSLTVIVLALLVAVGWIYWSANGQPFVRSGGSTCKACGCRVASGYWTKHVEWHRELGLDSQALAQGLLVALHEATDPPP